MAYTLWHGKLWSVHLNDQNGLKYDQDKTFGSVDLRRAFNQVWVLERGGFDGCIGLDVKAMRTTKPEQQTAHLSNSLRMFNRLLEVVRSPDTAKVESLRADRDYEALELYILETLMGR
ncbi:MAG: xylose isomerase, partial [Gemmataceae bacterium]